MNLLWMLSGDLGDIEGGADVASKACQLVEPLITIVTTVIWILVGVLGVVLIVKGVTTALAVVKAADEPQVRQEKLGAFKYLAIGLGVALAIAVLANTLLTIFGKDMITKALGGCSTTPNS